MLQMLRMVNLMNQQHPNRGHREYNKARAVLLCSLIAFIFVEFLIFLWVGCILSRKRSSDNDVDSTSQVSNNIVLNYDETIEWCDTVANISYVLHISMDDADDILHQIARIYYIKYKRQLYFCSEFSSVDGYEDHYVVASGDSYARFEIMIESNQVSYVKELSFTMQ